MSHETSLKVFKCDSDREAVNGLRARSCGTFGDGEKMNICPSDKLKMEA